MSITQCSAAARCLSSSRCLAAEVEKAVLRAVSILSARENVTADIEPGTAGYIASVCGGDVRKALNAVELLFSAAPREGNTIHLLRADAENITQRSAMHYDRAGDDHYDVVSALMKSLRGSDPDAALHYLARLLEAGDLIGACFGASCARRARISALPIRRRP